MDCESSGTLRCSTDVLAETSHCTVTDLEHACVQSFVLHCSMHDFNSFWFSVDNLTFVARLFIGWLEFTMWGVFSSNGLGGFCGFLTENDPKRIYEYNINTKNVMAYNTF